MNFSSIVSCWCRAARVPGTLAAALVWSVIVHAQALDYTAVRVDVDFGQKLRTWDGFGFNYVETAQTRDYAKDPQEYGGFSLLAESERQKIVDLVFGEDGLRVGLVKMFLDPFHQTAAGGAFDHETTTRHIRAFVRAGLKTTRARGADLTIITTMYGPPAYMTAQKVMRGRDLLPEHEQDFARYLVAWAKFLREKEGLPVRYLSLHNEGEDWRRWTAAGLTDNPGHDYNVFLPPEQLARLVKVTAAEVRAAGLRDLGVTPGECTNWFRFSQWGYAAALAGDREAVRDLGLITSHGFYSGGYTRWFGDHQSAGIDELRAKKPELKAWVTSTSWSAMDTKFMREMYGNIYSAKVNGIIPWAGIQRPPQWVKGDPNPGSAFRVNEDGTWEIRRGYYFYKQLTRAGQPGMAVARTSAMDSEVTAIAFAANGTKHADAFVVTNQKPEPVKVAVRVQGGTAKAFQAFRTTEDGKDKYASVGSIAVVDGQLVYEAPGGSATTFFAQ